MKKMTIAALGLALSVGAWGTASAQSSPPQQGRDQRREQRGDTAQGGRRRGGPEMMLLRGITLTDAQKAKLQALRNDDSQKGSREEFRKAAADARAARERGDTVAATARMRELRTRMDAERERHVAAIRGLLTSEQQRQFDANVAEWKQHAEQRGPGGRDGGPGGRPERGARG